MPPRFSVPAMGAYERSRCQNFLAIINWILDDLSICTSSRAIPIRLSCSPVVGQWSAISHGHRSCHPYTHRHIQEYIDTQQGQVWTSHILPHHFKVENEFVCVSVFVRKGKITRTSRFEWIKTDSVFSRYILSCPVPVRATHTIIEFAFVFRPDWARALALCASLLKRCPWSKVKVKSPQNGN